jgi:hypothetical protein
LFIFFLLLKSFFNGLQLNIGSYIKMNIMIFLKFRLH